MTGGIRPENAEKPEKTLLFAGSISLFIVVVLTIFLRLFLVNYGLQKLNTYINGTATVERQDLGWNRLILEGVTIVDRHNMPQIRVKKIVVEYDILQALRLPLFSQVIKSIDVYEPDVLLYQEKRGAWNLPILFPQGEKPLFEEQYQPHGLRFSIFLHKGTFRFEDSFKNRMKATITPINGKIRYVPGHWSRVHAKGETKEDGSRLIISGEMAPDFTELALNVKGIDFPADKWGNYIIDNKNIIINKGKADLNINLLSEDLLYRENLMDALDIQGRISLKNVSVKAGDYSPHPVNEINGEINILKDIITADNVSARFRGDKLSVSGQITGFESPVLRIYANMPSLNLDTLSDSPRWKSMPVKLRGRINLNISAMGSVRNPQIHGTLKFREIEAQGQALRNGNINATYFGDTLEFTIRRIEIGYGEIKGQGWINNLSTAPRILLELNGNNASIGSLAGSFFPDHDVQFTTDFSARVIGNLNDPLIMGDTSFDSASYEGQNIGSGSTSFLYGGKNLILYRTRIHHNGGSLSSNGSLMNLAEEYLDMNFTADNFRFPTGMIPSLSGSTIQADARGRIMGNMKNPIAFGSFKNGSVSCQKGNFSDTSGEIIYFGKNLVLDNISGVFSSSRFNLDGMVALNDKPTVQAVYSIDSLALSSLKNLGLQLEQTSDKAVNLKGFLSSEGNRLHVSAEGQGNLGELAGLASYDMKTEKFLANLVGWDMETASLLPSSARKAVRAGKSNFILQAGGTPEDFRAYFVTVMKNSRILGLPLSFARGTLAFTPQKMKIEEAFVSSSIDPSRNNTDEAEEVCDLWREFPCSKATGNLTAGGFIGPFLMDGMIYTEDGWQIPKIAPVGFNPSLPFKIIGNVNAPLFVLNRINMPATGLLVWKKPGESSGHKPIELPDIYDISLSGLVNLATGRMDIKTASNRINVGQFINMLDLSPFGIAVDEVKKLLKWNHVDGIASLDAKIYGYWFSPHPQRQIGWEGKMEIEEGIINHEPCSFSAQLRGDQKNIHIDSLILSQPMGYYEGMGTIETGKNPQFDLGLKIDRGRLERLLSFTPLADIPARGIMSGGLRILGNLRSPQISGDIFINNANIYNQPISHIATVIRSRKNITELDSFTASIDGSVINGNGTITGGNLDFRFAGKDIKLSSIRILEENFSKVSGTTSFDMKLGGKINDPSFELDMDAVKVAFGGDGIEKMEGRVSWEDNRLSFLPVKIRGINGSWDLSGNIYFPGGDIPEKWERWTTGSGKAPRFDLSSNFTNWNMNRVFNMLDHPLETQIGGNLNGHFDMKGELPFPESNLQINIDRGYMGEVKYDSLDLSMTYKDGNLRMNELEFISPDSHMLISGELNRESTVFLGIDIKNLPIALFYPLFPSARLLTGSLFSRTLVTGDYRTPDMVSNTFIKGGSLGEIRFDQLGGELSADKGVINLSDFGITKGKEEISLKGKIPVEIRDYKIINPQPLDLSAEINRKNLDVLSILIPYMAETSGTIRGRLSARGIYPDILFNGGLGIRKGMIKLSFMNTPIESINAGITLDNKEFNIRRLSGKMGQGTFDMQGVANLSSENLEVSSMNFNLNGRDLLIQIPGFVSGIVSAKLTLSGSQDDPLLGEISPSGEKDYISLRDATLSMPREKFKDMSKLLPADQQTQDQNMTLSIEKKLQEKKGEAAVAEGPRRLISDKRIKEIYKVPRIRNLNLELSENVWLELDGLLAKTRGTLEIMHELDQNIRLFGTLEFFNGTFNIPIMAASFRIDQGLLTFMGGDPIKDEKGNIKDYKINPHIDFNAETTVSGVDIFLKYKGTLDDLISAFETTGLTRTDLNLTSIPALPRNTIMQLIFTSAMLAPHESPDDYLYGNTYSVGGATVNVLSNYIQGLFLTPITQRMTRLLTLSEFSFELGVSGTWNLRVAKALDPDGRFSLLYGQTRGIQGSTMNIWGIQYRYSKNMRILVENVENAFLYSLVGQLQFDNFREFYRGFIDIFKFINLNKQKKNPPVEDQPR